MWLLKNYGISAFGDNAVNETNVKQARDKYAAEFVTWLGTFGVVVDF
jgi:hypothetical protein